MDQATAVRLDTFQLDGLARTRRLREASLDDVVSKPQSHRLGGKELDIELLDWLLVGAYLGAVLLAGGDPWAAYLALFRDHLASSLASPWKTGAIAGLLKTF